MEKLLYIGKKVTKAKDGGEGCQKNWEHMLLSLFNENFFSLYVNEVSASRFQKIRSYLNMTPNIVLPYVKKKINEYIKKHNIKIIFLCSSSYGVITKYLKKKFSHIIIITFFHNIEILYAQDYLQFSKPKSWYLYLYLKYTEHKSAVYSDFILNINSRDADNLLKIYGRASNAVIPYSIQNKITKDQVIFKEQNKLPVENHRALCVGSAFFGNIQGIRWFVQNILPKLPIIFVIVGTGMDEFFQATEKIEVHGFVDDLKPFYENADFVLLPIISGSGMKTKTAEAMMYGKIIVGTNEAFSGYITEGIKGLFRCNTADEFEKAVHDIYNGQFYKFNKEIYNHFLSHYSNSKTIELCRRFFEDTVFPAAMRKDNKGMNYE